MEAGQGRAVEVGQVGGMEENRPPAGTDEEPQGPHARQVWVGAGGRATSTSRRLSVFHLLPLPRVILSTIPGWGEMQGRGSVSTPGS